MKLLDKILFLKPGAQCSVHPQGIALNLFGNETLYELDELQVIWAEQNTENPPTQEELDTVTDEDLHSWKEAIRKYYRDQEAAKNLSLKAGFNIEKQSNPNLTFSQYLDELESLAV